jgi:Cys-tRNA(Pro)/Cys-tRNA(Cys) deacylase
MASTPALKHLAALRIGFALHPYDYDPSVDAIGLAAARALGIAPASMLKTLMVEVDGRPGCCVLPSDRQLSMKRVAAALGGKQAEMMPPAKAERLTGYRVGGISPFGQRRVSPTVIETQACDLERVWINAGQRGLLVSMAPADALRAADATAAALIA